MAFVRIDDEGTPQPITLSEIRKLASSRSPVPPAEVLAALSIHKVKKPQRPDLAWDEDGALGPIEWDGAKATRSWTVTKVKEAAQNARKAERLDQVRRGIALRVLASDWTQVDDSGLTAGQKAAWATWRAALRALYTAVDPFSVDWPNPPAAGRAEFIIRLQALREG
ncbi:MAG: phage tail assembly chaperone [Sphingomonadaceae bacterium]|nr:phage tail assembly chaperone [Sphingomonadaceae bacterium]